jgi:hypothetical protein
MAGRNYCDSFAPISRRVLFRNAAATLGGLAVLISTGVPAEAKMTQQAAKYQPTPKNGQSCATCALFNAPASCNLIDGEISPTGWCNFYAKKASGG